MEDIFEIWSNFYNYVQFRFVASSSAVWLLFFLKSREYSRICQKIIFLFNYFKFWFSHGYLSFTLNFELSIKIGLNAKDFKAEQVVHMRHKKSLIITAVVLRSGVPDVYSTNWRLPNRPARLYSAKPAALQRALFRWVRKAQCVTVVRWFAGRWRRRTLVSCSHDCVEHRH